jgi:hypothetical protein
LKFLLDQVLSTIPQHHWASKLLGFNFRVEYKPGKQNTVADALSRREEDNPAMVLALSIPHFALFDDLRKEADTDQTLLDLRAKISAGQQRGPWSLVDGLVVFDGRIYVPASSPSLVAILTAAHGMGHEGIQKTLHRLRGDFHVPNAQKLVQEYIRACATCQRNKSEQLHPAGILQPLGIPEMVWSDIAMDFVEGLPRVNGKSVILTVVDHFSKSAHFIPLGHPYSASTVAQAFFDTVVRLHGIPSSIVSDRDPIFTSKFWTELFRLAGVKLNLSSAFHPQSDGQSEVTNKIIVMYLRCLTGDRPRQWLRWLPWAEYCFNTSFQTSLKTTPFKVVYGRDPPCYALLHRW